MKGAPVSFPLQNLQAITLFVDDLPQAPRSTATSSVWGSFTATTTRRRSPSATPSSTSFPTPAAHELIEPARVAGAAAGSRMQLTVQVDDVDATCAALAERGVRLLNGPMDRPWGIRTAAFADPAGHVWEIAAPLEED